MSSYFDSPEFETEIRRLVRRHRALTALWAVILTILRPFGVKDGNILFVRSKMMPYMFCKAFKIPTVGGVSYLVFSRPGAITHHEVGHVLLAEAGFIGKRRNLGEEAFCDIYAMRVAGVLPTLKALDDLAGYMTGKKVSIVKWSTVFGTNTSFGKLYNAKMLATAHSIDQGLDELKDRRQIVLLTAFEKYSRLEAKFLFSCIPAELRQKYL